MYKFYDRRDRGPLLINLNAIVAAENDIDRSDGTLKACIHLSSGKNFLLTITLAELETILANNKS